ncbi:MAG: aminoacyl-tRNA deacylase [Methyloceanibacter sp.]|uniref:aminoacyl-tRNA deacylase n=1 Tax=Methyloceanibacter sp. TaxID=1965321 RepID=UPI003D6D953C
MAIAPTLAKYLAAKNVAYDVLPHEPTQSSMRTAQACHIPGERLAKAVLIRDEQGYALVVLPASHYIRLSALKRQLGDDIELASEREIVDLFEDCARGAIPAIGECYGLDMVVDDDIDSQPEVYFEGGDHVTLIHMSHAQFARLMAQARHGRFSGPH